jgi:hypothetical protein
MDTHIRRGTKLMTVHLYFSLIPEALIASMLSPEEFGQYYATGHRYKTKGQAVFFDVDPAFRHEYFQIDAAIEKCVPHADGAPKNSVYISTYRVLEHIPLNAIGKLYMATAYGQTLELDRCDSLDESEKGRNYLYQDLAPVNSLVVSTLGPEDYYHSVVTKPSKFITFPALAFVDLRLGELARDPESGNVNDLPYSYIHHLQEALLMLDPQTKQSKLVDRLHSPEFLYRMVRSGFFIGNGPDFACYKMPSHEVLRRDYHAWWRSANL